MRFLQHNVFNFSKQIKPTWSTSLSNSGWWQCNSKRQKKRYRSQLLRLLCHLFHKLLLLRVTTLIRLNLKWASNNIYSTSNSNNTNNNKCSCIISSKFNISRCNNRCTSSSSTSSKPNNNSSSNLMMKIWVVMLKMSKRMRKTERKNGITTTRLANTIICSISSLGSKLASIANKWIYRRCHSSLRMRATSSSSTIMKHTSMCFKVMTLMNLTGEITDP